MRKKIKGAVGILCMAVWITAAFGCKRVENEAAKEGSAEGYEAAEKQFAASGLAVLPEKWYAGQAGKQPVVKNQGSDATCWALTASSALEAALLPEQEIVFSAEHIVLNNAFTAEMKDGGDYLMLMAYLSSWQGPVTEKEDPYGDAYSPQGLEAAVHVQEMQLLKQADLTEIKQMLYQYGAVQTSLHMNRTTTERSLYYNEWTAAYYMSEQAVPDHDILVLGWDDTFSRFRFAQIPPVDGAFICQNTWGDEFGKNGIFYVSYADANILQNGLVYSRVENADNYDMIYQLDDCGWQGKQGYGSETCWFASVYTAGQGDGQADVQNAEKGLWQASGQNAEDGLQQTGRQNAEEGLQQADVQNAEKGLWQADVQNTEDGLRQADVQNAEEGLWQADVQNAEEGLWQAGGQNAEKGLWQAGGQNAEDGLQQTGRQNAEKGLWQAGVRLAAIGFYATAENTQYEIYLVRNFETSHDLVETEREFLQSGSVLRAGYYTVDLEKQVELENGEKFAIVVKITTPGETNPVAVEYRADEYTQNVILEGKESYLSLNGNRWECTQERFGTNVCLKAYSVLEQKN